MLTKSSSEVIVTLPTDREIVFTRVYERSRHLLFDAWTKPEHVKQWYHCEGASIPVCEIDLRVGGKWNRTTIMPDGSEHPFSGVFQEIVLDRLLVYSEQYHMPQFGNPEWVTTVKFEDCEEGTRLTYKLLHASREVRDGHLKAGMEQGTTLILNKLDECAGEMAAE